MMEYKIADHIAAMKPSAIREIFKVLVDPEVIALSAGSPDSSAYPVKEMAEVGDEIFANEFVTTLGYGTTEATRASRADQEAPAREISDRHR